MSIRAKWLKINHRETRRARKLNYGVCWPRFELVRAAYKRATGNRWTKSDSAAYDEKGIRNVSAEKILSTLQAVVRRTPAKINCFNYFVKEHRSDRRIPPNRDSRSHTGFSVKIRFGPRIKLLSSLRGNYGASPGFLYMEVLQKILYNPYMSTISSKGQVTVPKAFREKLGLRSGTRLEFSLEGAKLVMKKVVQKDPFENWIGEAKSRFRRTTDEIVDDLRGGPPEAWLLPSLKHKKKS